MLIEWEKIRERRERGAEKWKEEKRSKQTGEHITRIKETIN